VLEIETLGPDHDREGFDCGVEPLNRYLREVARQHAAKDIARTYVLVETGDSTPKTVHGFVTLSICQVSGEGIPAHLAKKLPKNIPAIRLGRLAVDRSCHGQGLGKALLVEAMHRAARAGEIAGGIGLFIDAKDQAIAEFYAKFGFEKIPFAPLTLFLPMGTLRDFCE
jgi:ribosomal protein S18 acetylase RimI-like enzyme